MKVCSLPSEQSNQRRKCVTTFQSKYIKFKKKNKKEGSCKEVFEFKQPLYVCRSKIYRNPHFNKQQMQIKKIQIKQICTDNQNETTFLLPDRSFLNLCYSQQYDIKSDIERIYSKFKSIQDSVGSQNSQSTIFYQFGHNIIKFSEFYKNRQISLPFHNIIQQDHEQFLIRGDFQSGSNVQYHQAQHNLFLIQLKNDTNTKGFTQWFHLYFKVNNKYFDKNLPQIGKKFKAINFVILNIKKPIKYIKGMRLLTKIQDNQQSLQNEWRRNLQFCFFQTDVQSQNGKHYYSIAFSLQIQKLLKGIYVSLCYPYPFSRLNYFLQYMKNTSNELKVLEIGKSTIGNPILLYRMQSNMKAKKNIIIIGRQHASQTASSFVCQFIIKRISVFRCFEKLLNQFNIHIIPMLNPDGVIHGNSRANFRGYDINRCWAPYLLINSSQAQSVYNYFQKIDLTSQDILLDVHSHSREFGFFSYSNEENNFVRSFNQKINQSCKYFDISKCRTVFDSQKKNTFRVQMWNRFRFKNVLTLQISYYGYISKSTQKLQSYKIQDYQQMADNILQSLQSSIIKYPMSQSYGNKIKLNKKYSSLVLKQQVNRYTVQKDFNDIEKKDYQQSDSDTDPQGDYLNEQDRNQIQQFNFQTQFSPNQLRNIQISNKNLKTQLSQNNFNCNKIKAIIKQKQVNDKNILNLFQVTKMNEFPSENSYDNKSNTAFSINTRVTNTIPFQKQQIFRKRCQRKTFNRSVNSQKISCSKQIIVKQNYLQRQSFKNLYISAQLRNQKLLIQQKDKKKGKNIQIDITTQLNQFKKPLSIPSTSFSRKNKNNIKNIIFPEGMPNKQQYDKQIKTIENLIRRKNVPTYSKYFVNQKKIQIKGKEAVNIKIGNLCEYVKKIDAFSNHN